MQFLTVLFFQVSYTNDGLEAIVFTSQGDMRQALNNLQSTVNGFGHVNRENVFKVCDEPHPLLVSDMLLSCTSGNISKAYEVCGLRVVVFFTNFHDFNSYLLWFQISAVKNGQLSGSTTFQLKIMIGCFYAEWNCVQMNQSKKIYMCTYELQFFIVLHDRIHLYMVIFSINTATE